MTHALTHADQRKRRFWLNLTWALSLSLASLALAAYLLLPRTASAEPATEPTDAAPPLSLQVRDSWYLDRAVAKADIVMDRWYLDR
jgi:hypothetical protein